MKKYSISQEEHPQSLLRDGQPFFTSPFLNPCEGELRVGLVMPQFEEGISSMIPELRNNGWLYNTEVVVGGGGCCFGYVHCLNSRGQIVKILPIDFNICFIVPIIWIDERYSDEKYRLSMGLLLSGAGCAGQGVRFLDLNGGIPVSIPIIGTKEYVVPGFSTKLMDWSWYNRTPIEIDTLWERLEKAGIKVDREKTDAAIAALPTFRVERN